MDNIVDSRILQHRIRCTLHNLIEVRTGASPPQVFSIMLPLSQEYVGISHACVIGYTSV
jgi:hypothetical protein